ncbi:MAG: kelch repeat-containing protein [Gemmatimonas sp.]
MWISALFLITSLFAGLGVIAPTTPPSRSAEGTMQLVARMRVARSAATSTTLPGDRVLIAGGMTQGNGALRSFEVFDTRTLRITASGNMRQARLDHSATTLADGRVLLLGGYDGRYIARAEIFDVRTGQFTDAGSMNVGRSGHTATLLRDGTVLIVGGVGDGWSFLSSAEIYDSRTGKFTLVKPMSERRESHIAELLPDGRVLVAGGHRDRRENMVVYSSTEIYNPAERRFTAGPALTVARHKHDAAVLPDGRVLVFGGSDSQDRTQFTSAEAFDPATNRWSAVAPMATGRFKLRDTAVRLRDGRILVTGSGRFAELFDPRTNSFSTVAGDLGADYSFASATVLGNGDALALGGYDLSRRNTDGIWRFRP